MTLCVVSEHTYIVDVLLHCVVSEHTCVVHVLLHCVLFMYYYNVCSE